jgi:hypothetical protein
VRITVADGRVLPHSNRQVTCKYTIAGVPQEDTFHVAAIGDHSIILGMPWLERVNPSIDWQTKEVSFTPPQPKEISLTSPILPSPVASEPMRMTPISRSPRPALAPAPAHRKKAPSVKIAPEPTPGSLAPPPSPSVDRPFIGIASHIYPGDQVFLAFYYPDTQKLTTSGHDSDVSPVIPEIPEEYRDLADVFSKAKADQLPPHRGSLDHSIPLEEGAKPPFGPIYNLSELELQVLREYIDEHLSKGFIRPSSSPFGAPVLFVKKPHGRGLRLCVDYRALNRVTVKNRYPLPLISELFDRLKKATRYTKIDLRTAYNLLRIAKGEEFKTAFRTRFGHFEYCVMPFGLTNAPATFQSYINSVLHEYLDVFCTAYMDDILVYSETYEEHVQHVRKVLTKLLENGLYVSLEKCEFHVQEVNFLGYMISPSGISMEKDRVSAIVDWPVPTSVHDIQVFLGFANFYRRFIRAYSNVVVPMTDLLKKSSMPFQWTSAAQKAFDELKQLFSDAPVLRHFNPDSPIFVFTDASGFAMSGIICQSHDGQLHPVAFWSRKFTTAECNYDIHDQELLAIVSVFQHWRHYLEGAKHTVTVYTDHKNLEVFMTTKVLNRRQARWAELLAGYDFIMSPIPGTKNPADGLSRRPDYAIDIPQPSGTILPSSAFINLVNLASVAPAPELEQQIIAAYSSDRTALLYLPNPSRPWSKSPGNLLLYNNLVYVPESLRLQVLQSHHDTPLAGHPGIARTLELVSRNYYFPGINQYVTKYVSSCDFCSRAKPPRHRKYGELSPLPVPNGPWKGLSCDFITDLPVSHGYDSLLVFVDRFTKMKHLVPCTKTATAPDFARMFLDHVIRLHGIPDSLVSDRGTIFTSQFWSSLSQMLGLKQRLSTAFHPQTDGQTERMNQIIEQYLRIYCNYQQDNWYDFLSLAEFSYNNCFQSSLGCSPFFANYGYHPRFNISVTTKTTLDVPAAKQLAEQLAKHHDALAESLKAAQDTQARYYDAKHRRIEFKVGDKVWLLSTNVHTERPSKKLDWKRLGPFTIIERIGLQAYRLKLPKSMRIHPVFHVSLLEPYTPSTIPNRTQPPPPPVVIPESGDTWYEIQEILDSRYRRKTLYYKIRWKGYDVSEDSWQRYDNVTQVAIDEFHLKYPTKPGPSPRLLHSQPRSSHPRRYHA